MSGVPDYPLEQTLDFKFTTRAFSTGVPTTLAGTPAIEIYEDNSITQITAAETLTVDFDGKTGLNNLRIAATAANGFESGKSYQAVISAGTVGGVSVVGEVVQQFSIERSPSLAAGPLAQLNQNLNNCFTGTASGTPTTTTMVSDVGVTVDDQFNGRIITFDNDTTTAALRGQSTDITACTAATNTLIFTALTTAPVSGDTFTIT